MGVADLVGVVIAIMEQGSSGEEGSFSGSEGEEEEEEEDMTMEGGDLASQVNEFFSEMDMDQSKNKRRLLDLGLKTPRRKSILPPHLHAVMGSANLRLARKDTAGAMELCKEVIRQAPQACEPYLTLATVYEELQDTLKLFQILFIAAHLKRTDLDLWLKCATLAKKQENFRVATQCISKAILLDPKNIQLMWERASLYSKIHEIKKAIDSFEQILEILPSDLEHDYVQITKELAVLYHEVNNSPKAVEILGNLLVTHPHLVDEEIINILAELCIISKAYEQVYEVITGFYQMIPQPPPPPLPSTSATNSNPHDRPPSGSSSTSYLSLTDALRISISGESIELEESGEEAEDQHEDLGELLLPDGMPVDLRVKLALAMINLGKRFPEKLLEPIFSSPEEYGDLFLDIGDAYISNTEYTKALPLLSALVGSSVYSPQAGVWLKYAECQYMLNDLEGAVVSYSRVLSLAPHHTDTRLQLATLYVQMGQADDALEVLESEPNSEKASEAAQIDVFPMDMEDEVEEASAIRETPTTPDLRITLEKYRVLYSTGKLKEYVKEGCSLLAFLFREVYNHPEIKVLIRLKIIKKSGFRRGVVTSESKRALEMEKMLSPLEWFNLFSETCKGLLKLATPSSHYKLTYFIYCAVVTTRFTGSLEKPFIYFSVSLSYNVKDYGTVFMLLRDLCFKELNSKHLWNIVNLLPFDEFNKRFMLRLCHKHASPLLLRVLANYSMTSAGVNIRFCLSQFEQQFREGGGKDYLLSLCIAIVYINTACQVKSPPNKNAVVTMAAGFLHTYVRLRGECQESMYNMGRAFHQLGIVHIASHFYKKVLIMNPECQLSEWRDSSDLRSEAAFNLSLIYKASGNLTLARDMLRRYCTV